MSMQIQPYLFFEGRCQEALEYYRRALGAEVTALMRFKESPDPDMIQPGSEDKVMHASFRVGETTVLASDGRCGGHASFQGFALSLTVPNEREADRLFAALVDGGQVIMPLTATFFSAALRHDHRPLRRVLDGLRGARGPGQGRQSRGTRQAVRDESRRGHGDARGADRRGLEEDDPGRAVAVGVTAHHLAGVLEPIAVMIETVATGRPVEPFSMSSIDEMNARHARDYAGCTRAETIELLRKGVATASAAVRRLSDDQLTRSAQVVTGVPPMTVEQLVAGGLLGHIDDHFGSIRKTVGR